MAAVAAVVPQIERYGRYHDHIRGNAPNPPIKSTPTHRGLFFGVNQMSMHLISGLFTFFLDYLTGQIMQKIMPCSFS